MSIHRTFTTIFVGAALSLLASLPASAVTVRYELNDHPDRAKKAYDYGIRLDSEGKFFSFNGPDQVILSIDTGATPTASIFGNVIENGTSDVWELSYTFTNGVTLDPDGDTSDGEFTANDGVGTLRNLTNVAAAVINLTGKSNGVAEFLFLDDNHRLAGHSGFSSLVGRGWLDASGTNDFLFTATVVPLPAALPLLAGGLGVLGLAGWRRRKTA